MSVVKRAISLPKDLDARLVELLKGSERTYSGLVCEALGVYLRERDRMQLEKAYARYYRKGLSKEHRGLIEDFARLSAQAWP